MKMLFAIIGVLLLGLVYSQSTGSLPLMPTITHNATGYIVYNLSQTSSFSLNFSTKFDFLINYITPTYAGITVNDQSYYYVNNTSALISGNSSKNIYMKALNISWGQQPILTLEVYMADNASHALPPKPPTCTSPQVYNATQERCITPTPPSTTYKLTETASPSGSGTVYPGTTLYNSGNRATISESAQSPWVFIGWTCTGTGCYAGTEHTATITMSANITETATFGIASTPSEPTCTSPQVYNTTQGKCVTPPSTRPPQPPPPAATVQVTTYKNAFGQTVTRSYNSTTGVVTTTVLPIISATPPTSSSCTSPQVYNTTQGVCVTPTHQQSTVTPLANQVMAYLNTSGQAAMRAYNSIIGFVATTISPALSGADEDIIIIAAIIVIVGLYSYFKIRKNRKEQDLMVTAVQKANKKAPRKGLKQGQPNKAQDN
jgi:hypothetical protein